mgnify:FL=1
MVDLNEIGYTSVHSKGIIEYGSVTIFYKEGEYMFDIEEGVINSNHRVNVFLVIKSDNETLNLNIDEETNEVLDVEFVNFIYDVYKGN